jgi:hypothetical protein
MTQQCPICVAVLEDGTDWQPELWGLQGRTDDSIVIRQKPGETEAQLLERLDETCAGLAESGREVRTAVFACRVPPDASAPGCSVHLVARLLAKLTVSPGARLVLVTDKQRGAAVNGLLALAGTLIERWVSDGIRVELCSGSSCAGAGLLRTTQYPAVSAVTPRHPGPGLARAGRVRRSSGTNLAAAGR